MDKRRNGFVALLTVVLVFKAMALGAPAVAQTNMIINGGAGVVSSCRANVWIVARGIGGAGDTCVAVRVRAVGESGGALHNAQSSWVNRPTRANAEIPAGVPVSGRSIQGRIAGGAETSWRNV